MFGCCGIEGLLFVAVLASPRVSTSQLLQKCLYSQEDLKSPTFLQDKLREYFLENKHHMTLVMTPDVSEVVEATSHVHGIEHVM